MTSYTFTLELATRISTSNYFIFDFDAALDLKIPNTLSSCTGVVGFTSATVPCIKLSDTQIRLSCYLCIPSSFPNYAVRIDGIINPVSALNSSKSITVATFQGSTIIDSSNTI